MLKIPARYFKGDNQIHMWAILEPKHHYRHACPSAFILAHRNRATKITHERCNDWIVIFHRAEILNQQQQLSGVSMCTNNRCWLKFFFRTIWVPPLTSYGGTSGTGKCELAFTPIRHYYTRFRKWHLFATYQEIDMSCRVVPHIYNLRV